MVTSTLRYERYKGMLSDIEDRTCPVLCPTGKNQAVRGCGIGYRQAT